MGASSGIRVLAAGGLVALVVGTVTACQPGELGAASVAYTTDSTATDALKKRDVDVSWLTCTGRQDGGSPAGGSPSESTVVTVDCQGKTKDGRDITVTGKVTRAVSGACVRGNLVAEVGGRQVFRVSGLGNCDAAPAYTPPATYRPPGQPRPTVTVTVTRTLWCENDPACRPVQGK
ncbi:hypothetical protein EV284_2705 [Streptomyces sp. BK022]|uniref:hypothetical protein n=1 Tax=Streptomyces sp. BK022 TaxID=2512123 RepID=UPI001028B919|nr:hypothetical protein [Streptomyces sp. BK022]RZU37532.1 hypothetical protein EV284_2705 [Streptomyces sp. BK022]